MTRTLNISLLLITLAACTRAEQDPTADAPTIEVAPIAEAPAGSHVVELDALADEVPALEPDHGIGPIRLGMSEAELARLGLPMSDAYAGKQVGPYRVLLEGGRVSFIEAPLAELPGLRIGGHTVPSGERDIARIADHLAGCGPLQILEGGNIIECHGGKVIIGAGGPVGIVDIQVMGRPLR